MEFGLTPGASNWHLHLPQGLALAFKGSSIDHGLSADAREASAVLQEDSLKPSSNSGLPIAVQHPLRMPALVLCVFSILIVTPIKGVSRISFGQSAPPSGQFIH